MIDGKKLGRHLASEICEQLEGGGLASIIPGVTAGVGGLIVGAIFIPAFTNGALQDAMIMVP